jgi:hypothetical protein
MMWQAQAIFRKKSLVSRNPAHGHQHHRVEPALHGAEAELPIFYSIDDFFLIRLRRQLAGPISVFQ